MVMLDERDQDGTKDREERVAIPLDPETAFRALLKVDPDAEPSEGNGRKDDESSGGDADG